MDKRSWEERYIEWLGGQIHPDRDRDFSELYAQMFDKEFVWHIPNDDNRIADGLELRKEFFRRKNVIQRGCSVLEVIVALSRRIAFAAGGDAEKWAWRLITNLELNRMSGRIGGIRAERIDEILERFIWRTYEPDGVGGLFPLAWPRQDQRKVELWYQMCGYIEELPEL
jgi:hypothetical protein